MRGSNNPPQERSFHQTLVRLTTRRIGDKVPVSEKEVLNFRSPADGDLKQRLLNEGRDDNIGVGSLTRPTPQATRGEYVMAAMKTRIAEVLERNEAEILSAPERVPHNIRRRPPLFRYRINWTLLAGERY